MDDYGPFCYLDVQKTGSTFISAFLRECSLIPVLKSKKHGTIRSTLNPLAKGGVYRKQTYYFNSVRNPFRYYASLYNYGLDRRGGLFKRLKRHGKEGLYEASEKAFLYWLEFLLDEENAHLIGEGYDAFSHTGIGLLTYRFLRLSMSDPLKKLARASTLSDIENIYEEDNISSRTIKNEYLKDELKYIVFDKFPEFFDEEKSKLNLRNGLVNNSKNDIASQYVLECNKSISRILQRKDIFIFDKFY